MTSADEESVIDTIMLAFVADPVARWMWPDGRQYVTSMPPLTKAFAGRAFGSGSALATDAYAGAALWLPPGVGPDEQGLQAVIERTVTADMRHDVASLFERMAAHHPKDPHWHLPMMGVDPLYQGQGHGDALLKHALERCDRDHLPAYLEATTDRNAALYRRHGFTTLATIQVGSSPALQPMLRQPK